MSDIKLGVQLFTLRDKCKNAEDFETTLKFLQSIGCDVIQISARSLGEINVQVLMEYLGGGGHLTMAGAQLRGETLEQAKEKIMESIDNYKK